MKPKLIHLSSHEMDYCESQLDLIALIVRRTLAALGWEDVVQASRSFPSFGGGVIYEVKINNGGEEK